MNTPTITRKLTFVWICMAIAVTGGLMPLHGAPPTQPPLEMAALNSTEESQPQAAWTYWFQPTSTNISQALQYNSLYHFQLFLGFPQGQDGLSWETAYIVEGLNFNETAETYCFWLYDMPIHVIVRNCTFVESLKFSYISHVQVYDCVFLDFEKYAITADDVGTIQIHNNLMQSTVPDCNTISFIQVKNGSVMKNTVHANGRFSMLRSSHIFVQNNTFVNTETFTASTGTIHISTSSHIQIAQNYINSTEEWASDGTNGISIRDSNNVSIWGCYLPQITLDNSSDTIVADNTIYAYGIQLNNATENFISNNTITGWFGIQLKNSHNNTFAFNFIRPDLIKLGWVLRPGQNTGIAFPENLWYDSIYWPSAEFNSTGNFFYANTIINANWSVDVQEYGWNNTFAQNKFLSPIHTYTTGSATNYWNTTEAGNVWGNYSAKYPAATSEFGIWNTPYETEIGQVDELPLVAQTAAPPMLSASLFVPDDILYNSTGNTGSFRAMGNPPVEGDATVFVLIDGLYSQNATAIFGQDVSFPLDGLSPGDHLITVTVVGRSGVLGLTSAKVSVYGYAPPACVWETLSQKIAEPSVALAWEALDEALGYRISVNGVEIADNWGKANTTYTLTLATEGLYVVDIVAYNWFGDSAKTAISIAFELPIEPPEEEEPAPATATTSWWDGPLGIIVPLLCAAGGLGIGLSLGIMLGKKRVVSFSTPPPPATTAQTKGGPSPNLPSYLDPNSHSNPGP